MAGPVTDRVEGYPLMPYYAHIFRCRDGSYYVGHTADVAERIARHNAGRDPSYTAARLPVELMYAEELASLDAAVARERQLKRWTRAKKEALVAGHTLGLHHLAERRR